MIPSRSCSSDQITGGRGSKRVNMIGPRSSFIQPNLCRAAAKPHLLIGQSRTGISSAERLIRQDVK